MFTPFYYDSNTFWDEIDSAKKWHLVTGGYPFTTKSRADLMAEARATVETEKVEKRLLIPVPHYIPSFGTRMEHSSPLTLAEWAKKLGFYDELL